MSVANGYSFEVHASNVMFQHSRISATIWHQSVSGGTDVNVYIDSNLERERPEKKNHRIVAHVDGLLGAERNLHVFGAQKTQTKTPQPVIREVPGTRVPLRMLTTDSTDGVLVCTPGTKEDSIVQANLACINAMRDAQQDWDGYEGAAFSALALTVFKDVITRLIRQTKALPTNAGGLGLIYEKSDRSYMSFEVFFDRVEMLEIPRNDYSRAVEITASDNLAEFINKNVERFFSSEYDCKQRGSVSRD